MRIQRTLGAVALGVLAAAVADAQSLNIDFGTSTQTDAGLAPSSFGGAAGQTGSWNQVGVGSVPNLVGLGGTPSGVSIAVTADDPSGYTGLDYCAGSLGLLINDNFYTAGTSTVVLSGLANDSYLVYFYDPAHTGIPTGNIDANGVLVSSINGGSGLCSFIDGVTYVTATVPVTAGTMTIQLTTVPTVSAYTGLAGIQLVRGGVVAQPAVPVLGTWGVALLAVLVLAGALLALRRLS